MGVGLVGTCVGLGLIGTGVGFVLWADGGEERGAWAGGGGRGSSIGRAMMGGDGEE
jgi:hypothetical protein